MARLIQAGGRTISVPDDATDQDISAILSQSEQPAAPPPPSPGIGEYAAAAGRGIVRGAADVPGMLGNMFEATVGGLDWLHNKFYGGDMHTPIPPAIHALSGQGIRDIASNLTGVDLGESAPGGPAAVETVAGFLPSAVTLGGGVADAGKLGATGVIKQAAKEAPSNAIKFGVVPGAATVAAQATGNPVLTALAPVVAGGGMAAAERGRGAQTTEAMHKQAADWMTSAKNQGVQVTRKGMTRISDQVEEAARKAGLSDIEQMSPKPTTAPTLALRTIQTFDGQPATLAEVHDLRQKIGDAISMAKDKEEKRIGVQMKIAFDKALTEVAQNREAGVAGVPGLAPRVTAQAIGTLKAGIAKYAQAEKAASIDRMFARAQTRSTRPGMYSGELLNEFKKLADNPKKMAMLTSSERAAVAAVARGGNVERIMRHLARISPYSNLLQIAGGILAGSGFQSGNLGPAAAVAIGLQAVKPALKYGGNVAQSALLRRRAALASAQFRGKPMPHSRGGLGTSLFLRGNMATSPPGSNQ